MFLEDDYKMDRKPNDRFDFRELSDTLREPLERNYNLMEDIPKIIILSLLDTRHVVIGVLSGHLTDSCS